ncbi:MAG TPA: XRE family transcriptional regulator [Candidatus Yonathbacteria bacterium]|nr:XRE family transcriptional regulator [Candidatus Yonathbacteria bacterium]
MKNKIQHKRYDIEKIKKLPRFDDILAEKLKDSEFKKRHLLAVRRLNLAQKIIEEREKTRMTQSAFAKELKTSQSFIARVESGNQNITVDVLMRMADVLSREQRRTVVFGISGTKKC